MIDIFSRSVPGWLVAPAESAELADAFLADTIARIGVAPGSLLADRGGSMTSKPVAQLLVDLGVARSQPAPRVERQPLQRGQLQDPGVLPRVPRPLRVDRGRPGVLRRLPRRVRARGP